MILTVAPVTLNTGAGLVTAGGRTAKLPRGEVVILSTLMIWADKRCTTKRQLLDALDRVGVDCRRSPNAINNWIFSLRRKLDELGVRQFIKNDTGLGFWVNHAAE